MDVAIGTPRPRIARVVLACPGPTPTRMPAAPVRIRCSADWYVAQPPTMTGTSSSAMKRLRFNGSVREDTCSADTTVPWMTNRSTPASMTVCANCTVRCGVSEAATVTPESRTCLTRALMRSASIGLL